MNNKRKRKKKRIRLRIKDEEQKISPNYLKSSPWKEDIVGLGTYECCLERRS
jgi:hypothetical protein